MTTVEAERQKYEKIWANEDYAKHSPGEEIASLFFEISKAAPGETVIDLGTGSGKGALVLDEFGLDVTILDLTFSGLDERAQKFEKVEAPLWGRWNSRTSNGHSVPREWDYGYCADVMEHIPPEYVMLTLTRVMVSCERAFFHICFMPDGFGKTIGEPLHLTVMPFEWWKARLGEVGQIVECRDLLSNGVFYVERRTDA